MTDITRSLQRKQELIAKSKKQKALLADLNAIDDTHHSPTEGKVDVLAEPSSTLPLWRRVDRQFWWNEWLSRPFIDSGVRSCIAQLVSALTVVFSSTPMYFRSCKGSSRSLHLTFLVSRRPAKRAMLRWSTISSSRGVREIVLACATSVVA